MPSDDNNKTNNKTQGLSVTPALVSCFKCAYYEDDRLPPAQLTASSLLPLYHCSELAEVYITHRILHHLVSE